MTYNPSSLIGFCWETAWLPEPVRYLDSYLAYNLGLGLWPTYSLRCGSFLGLPYRILIICLVKPTMETIGRISSLGFGAEA